MRGHIKKGRIPMELIKEKLICSRQLGKASSNPCAETDIVLTEDKPDINKILNMDVQVITNGFEVQNGRVLVYGTVKFIPLYLAEDGETKSVSMQTTFTDVLDVQGAESGMDACVTCKAGKVEYKNLNGRKLTAKAILDVDVSVMKESEIEAISDILEDKIEQQKKKVSYIKKNPVSVKLFSINEQAEIAQEMPAVFEVLNIDGKITNANFKVINNKVIVKANLDASILYTDEKEHKLNFVSVAVPFTEILDIDGITEDWIFMNEMNVCGISCKSGKDERGNNRFIDIEAMVESRTETAENKVAEIINDCYSVEKNTVLAKENIDLKQGVGEIKVHSGIRGQIELKDTPSIDRVYNLKGSAKAERLESENGQLVLHGKVMTELKYISQDENAPVCTVQSSIPFKENINYNDEADKEADLEVHVTGMSYTLNSPTSVEVRGNVEIKGILTKTVSQNFVKDITLEDSENKEKASSLTVCFVQKNDSLWDIAKRYSTSVSAILEANDMKDNESLAGKKLIVPKYKKSDVV